MTHLTIIKPLQCFSGPSGEAVLVIKVADSKGVLTVTYQAGGNLHHLDVASFSATMSHQGASSQANSLLGVLREWLSMPIRKRRDSRASFAAELQSQGFLPKLLGYAEEIVENKSERAAADLLKRDAARRARKKRLESEPLRGEPPVHEDVEAEGCTLMESVCEEMRGVGPFGVEFWECLQVPVEVRDIVRGLYQTDQLERELLLSCARLVHAKKYNHPHAAETAQAAIDAIIAYQQGEGRRDAARIVNEGLMNLECGKPFKPSPGKPISVDNLTRVIVAIYELKLSLGGKYPDRNAVFKKVNEIAIGDDSLKITRSNLGKMIRKLGLDEHIGGKRKSRKSDSKGARGQLIGYKEARHPFPLDSLKHG
ncbi:MAG: hypothetical protein ACYC67_13040 [Prosthecobacter sp.]